MKNKINLKKRFDILKNNGSSIKIKKELHKNGRTYGRPNQYFANIDKNNLELATIKDISTLYYSAQLAVLLKPSEYNLEELKFELNKTERKWIEILNIGGENNDFFYKFFSGDRYNSFNIEAIDYDLNECFESKKLERFIRSSYFILQCGSQLYLCKYNGMYYLVDSKDGGWVISCGNQIQNCINAVLSNLYGIDDLFKNGLNDEEWDNFNYLYNSDAKEDLERYRRLCESVGLKYSYKQQDYQNEIDEFDELMRKLGIYE